MRSHSLTSFGAVFQTEVLLNSKRIVPYAMMLLFSANALLWWGWGAAVHYGWATNGDFFIGRNFMGFSFLTLPFFTAFFMGDGVIRDFRLGVDPLLFSTPVSRTTYLLGKFFGNYFAFVLCQMAFALTLVLLQAFHPARMVMQPLRVVPYFKVFIVSVVIPHMVLAAFYFTVGTLTRNAKIVYGLAVLFYPLYIAYQILVLKALPMWWRVILDPLLMNSRSGITAKDWTNAELINQYVSSYGSDVIANRIITILLTAICLAILCFLFARVKRAEDSKGQSKTILLSLSESRENVYSGEVDFLPTRDTQNEGLLLREKIALPKADAASEGVRAHLTQLIAALGVEFRLLRAERGLILLVPLALFVSTMERAFYKVTPVVSYSGAYASSTAGTLLLFLLGLTIFYTGEAMHRDRETSVEPVLWSLPVPNYVLLLSKFLATLLLSLSLIVLIGLTAIALQILKGDTPVEVSAYLTIYSLILIPSIAFAAGVSIALNVLLRDKYLTYAVSIAISGGLYYLYGQGYNHWLYNPVLYQLWSFAQLVTSEQHRQTIYLHRGYWVAITIACLALAHLCFKRRPGKRQSSILTVLASPLTVFIVAVIAAVCGGILVARQSQ